ncbi:MAG: alcohol dehydrogenase, partial [Pseudomonadota bacterium]
MTSSFSMAPAAPLDFGPGRALDLRAPLAALGIAPGAPLALVADGAMITLGTAARIAEPLTRAGHPVLGPFAVNGEPKCAEVDAMVAGIAGAAGVIALGGG